MTKTKLLVPQKDGTGLCMNCNILVYPEELGCGCGATWPPAGTVKVHRMGKGYVDIPEVR